MEPEISWILPGLVRSITRMVEELKLSTRSLFPVEAVNFKVSSSAE